MNRGPAAPTIRMHDPERGPWLGLRPDITLVARRIAEVIPLLAEVETAARRGWCAAGFVAYEASPAFDPAMRVRQGWTGPLAWFAIGRLVAAGPPRWGAPLPGVGPWRPRPGADAFRAAVAEIRRRIADGRVYQINLTARWRAPAQGRDPEGWWAALFGAQPHSYSALITTDDWAVVSVSPELFFRLYGERIACRPMKGTRPRAPDAHGDRERGRELAAAIKDRAENVMILDMVRNDLGRIARPGTVRVARLWAVERHPTVWQMTSTALARTAAPLPEIFRALFPAASVTGAPKIEAMRILAELEPLPRGVYCGAIGWVGPGRRAVFNVGIRTLWIDRRRDAALYGSGCGIVWDSDPAREWREALDKTLVLAHPRPTFDLLETLLWRPERGFHLLRAHLARLRASAEYFDRPYDAGAIRAALDTAVIGATSPRRVRLTLDASGRAAATAEPLRAGPRVWTVGLARTPVSSGNVVLYHKTTWRAVYERARRECRNCDDAILVNERGEVTESTIANVVVRLHGELLTPAAHCGLLRGTMREALLARGRVREAVLRPADLRRAEELWLINSVRGWMRARWRA